MKKIMGVSLIALLTVGTVSAGAVDRVTLVDDTANSEVATTSYVKGAYNALGEAINSIDAGIGSVTEGSVNGAISVDGTSVAVHGLGSAAYTSSSAYDAAGTAATAEQNTKNYADAKILTVYTTWNSNARDTVTLSNPSE